MTFGILVDQENRLIENHHVSGCIDVDSITFLAVLGSSHVSGSSTAGSVSDFQVAGVG